MSQVNLPYYIKVIQAKRPTRTIESYNLQKSYSFPKISIITTFPTLVLQIL